MAASGEGAGRLVRERGRGLTYMQDDPLKGGVTVAVGSECDLPRPVTADQSPVTGDW
jgi:hypothetical protein